jgi:hypothetical protein
VGLSGVRRGDREAGVKALTANLATRPFRNNTVIGSIVAAVALGLLVATIYNLYIFLSYGSSYALLLDDQDRNRVKLEALEVEERSLVKQIEARDFETAFDQGSVANELILKRTFSWTELFNKLENLMPPEVMMSAIRPNVTSSTIVIRVEGVAKTHLAFLSLQEHLLAHEAFSEVYPVSIRRLNPSRPEITFILNFNYRQSERTPVDTVVAQAAAPPPAALPSAPAAGGRAVDERASIQGEVLRAAAAANALPVGRDGRPRTLEVIARRMVAPGGVYDPPAVQLPGSTPAAGQGGKDPQAGAATSGAARDSAASAGTTPDVAASSAATQDVTAALAAQQAAASAAGAQRGTQPDLSAESIQQPGPAPRTADSAASTAAPTGTPAVGVPEGTAGAGAAAAGTATVDVPPTTDTPATAPPAGSRRLQRRRPAAGATGGAQAGATGAVPGAGAPPQTTPGAGATDAPGAAVVPAAQPVVRPDVDLNFVNRPVAEVYGLLGKAHGVRFAVDAAVNRGATLNVNLSGLSLADVITTMAEVAHHRIIQLRPSIYQVVAISEGDSLLEPPVEEENLPATEGAP